MIKTYQEALEFIYQKLPMFQRIGAAAYKKDLHNTIALCAANGNPQLATQCIHIAGTNGKGSVSHLIAALLQSAGYKVGLYCSPHYKDFRERIKINGVYISKQYLIQFLNQNLRSIEEIRPSFFEISFVLAMNYFRDQKVDYAVIETGLGGRLDSTNVIQPLLSVITNISWDHADMLGDTLEKIAREKAGIIKNNTDVVIGRRESHSEELFISKARECNSTIYFAEELISLLFKEDERGIKSLSSKLDCGVLQCNPALQANYQKENIRTAMAAVQVLAKNHHCKALMLEQWRKAMEDVKMLTSFIGRYHWLAENILCESAHNEDGIKHLLAQLAKMKYHKLHIVCGFVKDKSLTPIMQQFPQQAKYYFAKANIPRGLEAGELMNQAMEFSLFGKAYSSVPRALAAAKLSAKKEDLILVTGSIFVVAEVL